MTNSTTKCEEIKDNARIKELEEVGEGFFLDAARFKKAAINLLKQNKIMREALEEIKDTADSDDHYTEHLWEIADTALNKIEV